MHQVSIPLESADAQDTATEPAVDAVTLRPALFARYGALARLRYDFPLVLVEGEVDGPVLRPLTAIIDGILSKTAAPGAAGEALRQQVLRLEDAIRERVARGARDTLVNHWRHCAADLLAAANEPAFGPLDTNLDRAREVLRVDGPVIDCDEATPKAILVHVWKAVHAAKAKEFRKKIDGLILRLSDILKADFIKSEAAHTPTALEASIGTSFGASFDFNAMSRVLFRDRPDGRLPNERERRIHWALVVLRSQRFYGPGRSSERRPGQPEPHSFIFESCAAALDAFRERLPEVLEFVKALSIAELEIENKYRAALHDPAFDQFNECDLSAEQLALLPSSLVCLRDGRTETGETVQAFEALASGLPIKVLIQTDDILGGTSPEPSRTAFGVGSARLATMAMGLNNAYVFQASSAHLCRARGRLVTGMHYDGPALFCVFSGAVATAPHAAAYLLAAAATDSRAFPTFAYDPSAGPDWVARFDLTDNPQRTADWPVHRLDYEDEALQRHSEDVAFTYVDFAACDRRYSHYCRPRARTEWSEKMVPASECLKLPPDSNGGRLPYILTVGPDDELRRTVIDEKIVEAARRCNDAWRRLQELAGINNSHATRLLVRERAAWEAEREQEASLPDAPEATVNSTPTAERTAPIAAAAAPTPEAPETDGGAEPAGAGARLWIETSRCTTCNECTQINNRLFAYNENMQAYVADPEGGTYREIVEAAESCQVSIIHPGKPRDLNEPNLDDLIARAELFN
ncbi:MAG TPA: ferredoxin [Thermohalobaculum sp.]|nr:ferredoxin [Thermohalobaculum sp.]